MSKASLRPRRKRRSETAAAMAPLSRCDGKDMLPAALYGIAAKNFDFPCGVRALVSGIALEAEKFAPAATQIPPVMATSKSPT